jgi:hypothetical protein
MTIRRFEDIDGWQLARELTRQVYVALDQSYINQDEFDRIYGLAAQTASKVGGLIHYLLNAAPPR